MRGVLSLLGETVFPAICLVGIAYNVLMTLNAPEGVRMKAILDKQISAESVRLANLNDEHQFLSDRADRLLSDSLDEDLLGERVRSVLGLVDRSEYMVRMDDLDRLASLEIAPNEQPVRYAVLDQPAR